MSDGSLFERVRRQHRGSASKLNVPEKKYDAMIENLKLLLRQSKNDPRRARKNQRRRDALHRLQVLRQAVREAIRLKKGRVVYVYV